MEGPHCLIVALGLALTFNSSPAQSKDMLDAIAHAEEALESGRKEDAAVLLRRAAREARSLDSETLRATIGGTIEKLLQKADRQHGIYRTAKKKAAAHLVDVARCYADQKWPKTAYQLLKRAGQLDQETAKKALEKLKVHLASAIAEELGFPPEPQQVIDNTALVTWFRGGRQPWGLGGWFVSAEGAESPEPSAKTPVIMSTKKLGRKAKVSVQVKMEGQPGVAALVFGGKNVYGFFLLSVQHGKTKSLVQVQRWETDAFKGLGGKKFKFSPQARSQWMTLAVEYDNDQIKVKVGGAPAFIVRHSDLDLSGWIGLYMGVNGMGSKGILYKNLKVEGEVGTKAKTETKKE